MKYWRLIISLALPLLAGFLGSFFTMSAIPDWYAELEKPVFSPPNWIFGPTWTLLYLLMGISVFLIWQKVSEGREVKNALWFFWTHLFFNAIWSPIFFGLKSPGWGFAIIIILWILIVFTIFKFFKISRIAAYLLLPYLFWVTFASVLNFEIWRLN